MINGNLKQFWIAMGGKEDIAYNNCQAMLSKFGEMKIKYRYSENPGGHTWPVWRKIFIVWLRCCLDNGKEK